MRFAVGAEQAELAQMLREVLGEECTPETACSADPEVRAGIWRVFTETGAAGLLVGEDLDGLGVDETYLVAVMEQAGYVAMPGPLAETLAGSRLLSADPSAQALLKGVLAGTDTLAADPAQSGQAAYLQGSAALLVGGWNGAGTVTLGEGYTVTPLPAMDPSRAPGRYGGGTRRPLEVSANAVGTYRRTGILATAAQLIGLSRRMLDLSVAYVAERRQFGAPIGSFQAVKHQLADVKLAIEFAAPLVQLAGYSMAAGDGREEMNVAMAKAAASDAAAKSARTAIQVHGAMGYTTEYSLHVYAKRAWALKHAWGSANEHRSTVATLLGVGTGTRNRKGTSND
ncbi:MAG: acyl-CoA dehydrogenase family protein [Actinomycetota bacterium]